MFSIAPSLSADVLPSRRFELLDRVDQDFGHVVDESDLGFWSSDLEAGMDWDMPQASGVYEPEEQQLYGYFDGMSTFDADDFEYQQSLLY